MSAPFRLLVLGSGGQLGRALMECRWPPEMAPSGLAHAALDIADAKAVEAAIAAARADVVICAAAYTAVDRAEAEPALAFRVNRDAPGAIAAICARHGAALIHISTDYVFDGAAPRPYREDDPIAPLSVYGRSKAEGEGLVRAGLARHVILRTSWVFAARGHNFVSTMLRLAGERDLLRIVDDQRGCPTAAADLARVVAEVAAAIRAGGAPWGTYHYAGEGAVTWADFAAAIFATAGERLARHPRIARIATAEFPTPARRPANSELDCTRIERALGVRRASWRDGLARMLDEELGSNAEALSR